MQYNKKGSVGQLLKDSHFFDILVLVGDLQKLIFCAILGVIHLILGTFLDFINVRRHL